MLRISTAMTFHTQIPFIMQTFIERRATVRRLRWGRINGCRFHHHPNLRVRIRAINIIQFTSFGTDIRDVVPCIKISYTKISCFVPRRLAPTDRNLKINIELLRFKMIFWAVKEYWRSTEINVEQMKFECGNGIIVFVLFQSSFQLKRKPITHTTILFKYS